MGACREIRRHLGSRALESTGELPARLRAHLGECPPCAAAIAAARLSRGLLRSLAEETPPPAAFVGRVLARLPQRPARPGGAEVWRPAWGLVPTFAGVVLALLLALLAGERSGRLVGLLPLESLSAGERLVLGAAAPEADLILAAVLGEERP